MAFSPDALSLRFPLLNLSLIVAISEATGMKVSHLLTRFTTANSKSMSGHAGITSSLSARIVPCRCSSLGACGAPQRTTSCALPLRPSASFQQAGDPSSRSETSISSKLIAGVLVGLVGAVESPKVERSPGARESPLARAAARAAACARFLKAGRQEVSLLSDKSLDRSVVVVRLWVKSWLAAALAMRACFGGGQFGDRDSALMLSCAVKVRGGREGGCQVSMRVVNTQHVWHSTEHKQMNRNAT